MLNGKKFSGKLHKVKKNKNKKCLGHKKLKNPVNLKENRPFSGLKKLVNCLNTVVQDAVLYFAIRMARNRQEIGKKLRKTNWSRAHPTAN